MESFTNFNNITSIRIVTIDHYMCSPIQGLDPCYSDFRGTNVKKVPVIRIFGTDLNGNKTCLHVHSVLPYLYIPYDGIDGDGGAMEANRYAYQIATSLDKALNIAMGQQSSSNQHVFKISLVKGIPFYGYHPKEHTFLKIYLYNPQFIKRAANLFQNGAIMGRVHQPHESHVPYILQFSIDYNLYGMSFLRVPTRNVLHRYDRNDTQIIDIDKASERNYLEKSIERVSISNQEIDINAAFILNPYELKETSNSEHANPGIASIWLDEETRRLNLKMDISSITGKVSQDRVNVKETESNIFHIEALNNRLKLLSDQTLNSSSLSETMISDNKNNTTKIFNLKNLLVNSVYPSEYLDGDDNFLNASMIQNHSAVKLDESVDYQANKERKIDINTNDLSIVDEDLIFSLTQTENPSNETFNEEEMDLLDIMRQLECRDDHLVDNDSVLAPLSQSMNVKRSQPDHDTVQKNVITGFDNIDDSDDDLFNDFSMIVESSDFINSSLDGQKFPQLDGMAEPDDCSEPKCSDSKNSRKTCNKTKYVPLKFVKLSSGDGIQPNKSLSEPPTHKSLVVDLTLESSDEEPVFNVPTKRKKRSIDLGNNNVGGNEMEKLPDEQNISTQLPSEKCTTEISPNHDEPKSKTIKLSDDYVFIIKNSPTIKLKRINCTELESFETKIVPKPAEVITESRYNFRKRPAKPIPSSIDSDNKDNTKDQPEPLPYEEGCELSYNYDCSFNFFPRPGCSHYDYYKNVYIPRYDQPPIKDILNEQDDKFDDLNVQSFYVFHTPPSPKPSIDGPLNNVESIPQIQPTFEISNNVKTSLEALANAMKIIESKATPVGVKNSISESVSVKNSSNYQIKIEPKCRPPHPNSVVAHLKSCGTHTVENRVPFYSNSNDVTKVKEIGSTVLSIKGDSLKDCPEFRSIIDSEIKGFNKRRKKELANKFQDVLDMNILNSDEAALFLATKEPVKIHPHVKPPTRNDAKQWLSQLKIKTLSGDKVDATKEAKQNEDHHHVNNNGTTNCSSDLCSTRTTRCLRTRNRKNTGYLPLKVHNNSGTDPTDVKCIDLGSSSNESIKNGTVEEDPLYISHLCNGGTENGSAVSDRVNESSTTFVNNLHLDDTINRSSNSFGISVATLDNTFGFKMDLENLQVAKAHIEYNYLCVISLEIHVLTRGRLKPDPDIDPIVCIFYAIKNDVPDNYKLPSSACGILISEVGLSTVNCDIKLLKRFGISEHITYTSNEQDLILELVKVIHVWDPDFFVGYEIEMSSWGYVVQRAIKLDINIMSLISRVPKQKIDFESNKIPDYEQDDYLEIDTDIKLPGRILLNVWRLLRHEISLTSYTFENVMFHILHRRYPMHSHEQLTDIWTRPISRWIVLEYYLERVRGTIELLDQLDLIGRTCELAKLFGIQFYEVLSRGSQFRVESMMLRIAKPKNIIPVSPSVQQRAHSRAPEYLPLILEPMSRFYTDPVIVLDFQSLYPSMIIAYNYCFSTCLGRIEHLGQNVPFEFGASHLRISPGLIRKLLRQNLITASPCGAVFVKSSVREGVLPRMLREILETRLMVKESMKLHKDDKPLQRVLHSRQLGLKLMANVTYGYTAANYSGRMPCVEVADSVVSKGRETLERAIKLVEANKEWDCKVVYGDTDSLFVLVKGRSREDAFKIGSEIAEAVTEDNPKPVKLKLEKVYQPCILQTKKRYVGYMYETPDQNEPKYEAKGIETVRRDGCPAISKMLEKTLKILFDTCDVSLVKRYICRQFTKILSGRANVQDLVFAKEFRGINGYKPGACVPALELTRKSLKIDRRSEPRRGERVPYIIINGPPLVPLIRLVRSPDEYLLNDLLKINSTYYITKAIIPPLNRCLLLIGANVFEWYATLPRTHLFTPTVSVAETIISIDKIPITSKKSTISQYFSATNCVANCDNQTQKGLCSDCVKNGTETVSILSNKIARLEKRRQLIELICKSCCGRVSDTECHSLDCSVLFVLNEEKRKYRHVQFLRELIAEHFPP